jgi:hypothetical protein
MEFNKKEYAATSVLKFVYHLKCAKELGKSFMCKRSNNVFSIIFKLITPKLDWCFNELITHHLVTLHIPDTVPFIREKWEADYTMELALSEKISLLTTEQQESLENVIDCLISGEEIKIDIK